jgi:hypothetical protein
MAESIQLAAAPVELLELSHLAFMGNTYAP